MLKNALFVLAGATLFYGCATNAVTGRSQMKLLPESQLQQMAVTEYQSFLSSNKVVTASSNNRDAEMVNRVGQRIINAVNAYYRQNNLSNDLSGYQWETRLVQSNEANAWCMPGGKIVVYTGLLPITQNEAALANVLGHEVSHALFGHTNERMSQGMAAQFGTNILDAFAANKTSPGVRQLFGAAVGVGSQVGLLAFSRKQELEADHYGIIWAAMAGYNPQEAIGLWQRMQAKAGSGSTPEFLSTHPGPEHRIEQLQKFMPEAMKYYRPVNK
ncbi:M48 family metallopeptidase [Niabella soli]|uniref:Peptidase M48 n=1 Tax=Niabella soli DSM 19437 TaxID=929713 RepID=W0F0J9_9BACT|nr:M48 family metallopeptidase [Niabella soli]AHF15348.1 peptidase M48 [Niabella soli DSM 19437]